MGRAREPVRARPDHDHVVWLSPPGHLRGARGTLRRSRLSPRRTGSGEVAGIGAGSGAGAVTAPPGAPARGGHRRLQGAASSPSRAWTVRSSSPRLRFVETCDEHDRVGDGQERERVGERPTGAPARSTTSARRQASATRAVIRCPASSGCGTGDGGPAGERGGRPVAEDSSTSSLVEAPLPGEHAAEAPEGSRPSSCANRGARRSASIAIARRPISPRARASPSATAGVPSPGPGEVRSRTRAERPFDDAACEGPAGLDSSRPVGSDDSSPFRRDRNLRRVSDSASVANASCSAVSTPPAERGTVAKTGRPMTAAQLLLVADPPVRAREHHDRHRREDHTEESGRRRRSPRGFASMPPSPP